MKLYYYKLVKEYSLSNSISQYSS